MKNLFFLISFLIAFTARAAEPIKVTSDIKQATIYLKGAILKNKASASIPAGRSTLLFTGLSYNILRESIRIKPEGCQILSVTIKKNYLDLELLDEKVKKLKDEYVKLQEKYVEYNDELSIYASEKEMILTNKAIRGEENGVEPEKLKAMADFYRQRLIDILEKEQGIRGEMDKATKRMNELRAQVNESAAKNIYPTSEVEVDINAEKSTTAQFDLEYYITEAGWFPAYDFRVNNLTTPMEIGYVAHIYQNSGLDWKNVEISVSSSDPGNNGGIPVLKPWYISQYSYKLDYDVNKPYTEVNKISGIILNVRGEPIPYATVTVENSSVGTSTDAYGKFDLAIPSGSTNITISSVGYEKKVQRITADKLNIYLNELPKALEAVVIAQDKYAKSISQETVSLEVISGQSYGWTTTKNGLNEFEFEKKKESGKITESNVSTNTSAVSFEYTLKEKMNIPSDGRPYTAQIMKREILAEYKHFASPKISRDAYLNIFIPDWEKLNLLEGEVNLYFGNSYTGKSVVSLRELKDSLEFSMGKDPNVKIQRTLVYQKTTGGGVLYNKTSEYRWNAEVRNISTNPIKIKVTEPFPVSTEKDIKVELAKELSGAVIDKEKGLLIWEMTLQPNEQKKLEFGFSVTYPKNLNMRFE